VTSYWYLPESGVKHPPAESRTGLLYGVAAYGFWGLMPLYFWALKNRVADWELLTQRIVWSCVLMAILTTASQGWLKFTLAIAGRRTRRMLLATALLIAVNWCCYIYAATHDQVTQASLGYFIAPLINTALGVFVLGERLRRSQQAAIALAAVGVVMFAYQVGEFPWLALGLAFSFGVYGLLRKTVAADALTGLAVESFLLMPFALMYLIYLQFTGEAAFGHVDRLTDFLLMAGSVVTVFPLYCFAQAARRLRLTTIGFLQFLAPTLQFALAMTREPFDHQRLFGFVFIWAALAIYSWDALRRKPATRPLDLSQRRGVSPT
jgi:chloramphenicol-sensitive protein RarD